MVAAVSSSHHAAMAVRKALVPFIGFTQSPLASAEALQATRAAHALAPAFEYVSVTHAVHLVAPLDE